MQQNCKLLYSEFEKTENLSKKSMHFLAEKLLQFINLKIEKPNRHEFEAVCKAALIIFPCLECEPSTIGGIVSKFEFKRIISFTHFLKHSPIHLLRTIYLMQKQKKVCCTINLYTKNIRFVKMMQTIITNTSKMRILRNY